MLSITKAIVEKHGGSVFFDSEVGKGTTFYVDLAERAEERAKTVVAAQDRVANGRRILVCEDDPDVAKLIELMLVQDGYIVETVGSAAEAKHRLAHRHYDAMTLDIGLPDQDGQSLIEELRHCQKPMSMPIVVVSARKSPNSADLHVEAVRIVDWLEKPIDHGRLLASVRQGIAASSSAKPRIIHVEDDPDVANIVTSIVGDLGVVVSVKTLAEARQRMQGEPFDLMILDLVLPDGSGEELLLLANAAEKVMPVIVFSARDATREMSGHIDIALTKSHTSNDQLRDAIRTALGVTP